jgi:hypothetical protein
LRLRSLLLSCLLLLPAIPALADTVYTYTGNDFTVAAAPYFTNAESVSGSFDVSSPLAAKMTMQQILPASFSFSDGYQTFDNSNAGIGSFGISTDQYGDIISWSIELNIGNNELDTNTTIPNYPGFGQDSGDVFGQGIWNGYVVSEVYEAYNVSDPGTWTSNLPPADPPAATPEPPSLAFMATGLLGLAAVVKRHRLA